MRLRRYDAWEFCDQAWLNGDVRQAYLDCLSAAIHGAGQYRAMAPAFSAWAQAAGGGPVIDIGSGAAGPVVTMLQAAADASLAMPRIVLSDLYPDVRYFQTLVDRFGAQRLGFVGVPLDAAATNATGIRLRSLCSVFHHFPPQQAKQVIVDATVNGDGFFIMEHAARDLRLLAQAPGRWSGTPVRSRRLHLAGWLQPPPSARYTCT